MTTAPESSGNFDANAQRAHRLERQRERMAAHRERRRKGSVQVRVDVARNQMAVLERLGLFNVDGGMGALVWAVERFLNAAQHVTAIGDALYPEAEGWKA